MLPRRLMARCNTRITQGCLPPYGCHVHLSPWSPAHALATLVLCVPMLTCNEITRQMLALQALQLSRPFHALNASWRIRSFVNPAESRTDAVVDLVYFTLAHLHGASGARGVVIPHGTSTSR
jgi:hypothetical protein